MGKKQELYHLEQAAIGIGGHNPEARDTVLVSTNVKMTATRGQLDIGSSPLTLEKIMQ